MSLTKQEKYEIQDLLSERVGEIESFKREVSKNQKLPVSVEVALNNEMRRLRFLAERVTSD